MTTFCRKLAWFRGSLLLPVLLFAAVATAAPDSTLRSQSFDRDPGWEGHNNRSEVPPPRRVRQDFGYQAGTNGGAGRIGGLVNPAGEPAYYARPVGPLSFDTPFSASGRVTLSDAALSDRGAGNTLVGFFDHSTCREWRTRNSLAIRLNGRGEGFHVHLEYSTDRWRSGAGFFRANDPTERKARIREFPGRGKSYAWSLRYDPAGNAGGGAITLTFAGEPLVVNLDPGHRVDGAHFDRFGILNLVKHGDDPGLVWLDDLTVNGEQVPLERDPGWDASGNRRTYTSTDVRPRFDFGFSPTHFAGGKGSGEIGGRLFRGDCRYPARLASYGDRLAALDLGRPLHASGRVCMRRGVTDSTVLLGFYDHEESLRVNPSQGSGFPRSFLGAAIEGPSREGFFLYPVYRTRSAGEGYAGGSDRPRIYPDGASHEWSLDYDPAGAGGLGRITLHMDGRTSTLDLAKGDREAGARFDRFGFVTTWIDGNGQEIYLDDLCYTAE